MSKHYLYSKILLIVATIMVSATLLLPIHGQAESLSITYQPTADVYVNESSPDINFGNNPSIRVDHSPLIRSFLRFDIAGIGGNTVTSAKLRIYTNSSNRTGILVAKVTDNSWGETSTTYKNSPAIGDQITKSTGFKKSVWIEVDITSYITGDGTYSLALTTQSDTNINMASRETGSKSPVLVVNYGTTGQPIPTETPISTQVPTQLPTSTQSPTYSPTPLNTPTISPSGTPAVDWQPSFPIRAAFYYPWFPEAWTQLGIMPYTNYTPSLGYYSASDQTILKKHIDMMNYGNIQAGIASWWGQGSRSDTRIAGLLSAATGTNFRWSLYYENESLGDPSIPQIQNDLTYMRDHYGNDPSYLRVNGKFVVFVYADANDSCGMADRWKAGNTVNAYVVLKVFSGYRNCTSQPDSWHQYSPAVATDQQGSESYSISPGFWLKGQPVRLSRDLTIWNQGVKSMVSSNAKWQLVTTFNEWGEGTIVEPASEWVSGSGYGQYLDALHNNGAGTTIEPTMTSTPTSIVQPTTTPTPAASPTPGPTQVVGASNTLLLAGDICKHNYGSTDYTANCKKTGDLIRSILVTNPGATVQTLGDNVNNDGGTSAYDTQYTDLYSPNWGSFLNVTRAVMGNHDTYAPSGTQPYYDYFGTTAGPNPGGYYSYDIGSNWHVIALNAQCSQAGGCSTSSPQYKWLAADLASNTRKCVLAVWHQPRWTSGRHSDDATSAPWWDLLYQYKVDIVANGHNHNYERFNLIDPNEQAAADGIREFIVGTGGAPADGYSYTTNPLDLNEAIRNQTGVYGVLKLTLGDNVYSWNYLPAAGYSFTDSGTTLCH